jgi:hypothetical protein
VNPFCKLLLWDDDDQNFLVLDHLVVFFVGLAAHHPAHHALPQKMPDKKIEHGAKGQADGGQKKAAPGPEHVTPQESRHIPWDGSKHHLAYLQTDKSKESKMLLSLQRQESETISLVTLSTTTGLSK